MFGITIKQVISISKPRFLKFYKQAVPKVGKDGIPLLDENFRAQAVTDKHGNIKAEPVTCIGCGQVIASRTKVRTAEVIAEFVSKRRNKKFITRGTAHMPLHLHCDPPKYPTRFQAPRP